MAILRSNHIPYLDGWRGVAIVLVLIGHFNDIGLVWLGPFGVMLFFALSGRLMCELLFIKKVELVTFFFRRFSRILPTFWLFLLIVFLYWTFLATVPMCRQWANFSRRRFSCVHIIQKMSVYSA